MNTPSKINIAPRATPAPDPIVKKSKRTPWIMLIVGVILLGLGGTSYFKSETINRALVEIGACQVASGVIEMHPDTAKAFDTTANVIYLAIEARTTSPEKLVALVKAALSEYTGSFDIAPILTVVISQINSAFASSETEELYQGKLKSIASGFRTAATTTSDL